MQADPAGARKNTRDNTPSAVNVRLVRGDKVEITVAAKGGGSEAKSKFAMLNPSDSVVEWVLKTVPTMGAGWCPPGMLGIGIGGTAEKAMLMAKKSLMDPIDIQELIAARAEELRAEKLRVEIYEKVNKLGIGAQGLGGLTTVLDVKVQDYPAHAANLPVAMIPNCAATRHAHLVLDGSGPAYLDPPILEDWPKLTYDVSSARRVNLDTVTRAEAADLEAGRSAAAQRQAAHRPRRRPQAHDRHAQSRRKAAGGFPQSLHLLRRAGGSRCARRSSDRRAPPRPRAWTSSRARCWQQTGLLGMVGKAERGPAAIEAIRDRRRVPDGRGRRGLPGFEGHSRLTPAGLRRPGHGSHLRIRSEGHAGHRGGGFQGHHRAPDRPRRVAAEDRGNTDTAVRTVNQ